MIPYGRQEITAEDIDAVSQVLQSDWITQGPTLERFEQAIATYCHAQYAVAVNSATSALHIACLALGVGAGDRVWTSPNTFVASANCARYCGAEIDFVDIDPRTYNMSVDALSEKLRQAEQENRLPKVVIPVHFAGQSCDMQAIDQLAKQYGFQVIEDASHAIGGQYQREPIGNCRYSAITVFSFHPVKIITTAEGGCAVTQSAELARKMALLRSHGITRDTRWMTRESEGPWYYEQIDLGFNYRLTDIQAALGLSQLTRLDRYVAIRHVIQERYDHLLTDLPLILPYQSPHSYSALHLYPVQIDVSKTTKTRKNVFEALRKAGIGVNVHYIPVHTQPDFMRLGFKWGDFPVAENYYAHAISLPMYATLTETDQQFVIDTLTEILS